MSESTSATPSLPGTDPQSPNKDSADMAILVYLLYVIGFFFPISAVAGVVVAYLKMDESDATTRSHFVFQIRTFWWGLFWYVVGWITVWVLVGFVILGLWFLWTLVRCIKGYLLIRDGKPVPDPQAWLW